MKIVSKQESLEWLKARFGCDFSWEVVKATYPHSVTYDLPVDTGAKTCLVRRLVNLVDVATPGLFWITTWGVWPSHENMALFEGYRKSLGESRHLIDSPGHIFEESDVRSLECLLDLALYFYWDSSLFDGAGRIVVSTSHDEFVSVYTKNEADLQKVKICFEDRKLPGP